jgi:hypothetical protein
VKEDDVEFVVVGPYEMLFRLLVGYSWLGKKSFKRYIGFPGWEAGHCSWLRHLKLGSREPVNPAGCWEYHQINKNLRGHGHRFTPAVARKWSCPSGKMASNDAASAGMGSQATSSCVGGHNELLTFQSPLYQVLSCLVV